MQKIGLLLKKYLFEQKYFFAFYLRSLYEQGGVMYGV